MYVDNPPFPNTPTRKVLVIEESDSNVDAVIEKAKECGATSKDYDGNIVFWMVFAENPRRMWDFTEESLRNSLKKRFA